jgi:integrase
MKLTTRTIAALALPAGKADHIEFDDDLPGFGLRLRKSGSRTWLFQYRIGAKQRRISLGNAAVVPVGRARETAADLHARVRLGGDPATDKVVAIERANETFGLVVERYLAARRGKLRPRTIVGVERHLMKQSKRLHRLPLTSVDQRTIADLLNEVAVNAGEVTSNRVRTSLSGFFTWAIKEGFHLPSGNPASNTNKRKEKPRDRVLKPEELKSIWAACREDDYGDIIKLLMLTAQRADEIARLQTDELHDEMIVLPQNRTKNNRAHVVPLSEPAKTILAPLRSDRLCVFGRDGAGFSGWSRAKATLDQRIAQQTGKPLPHWTPHDLRRTAATGMADLGVHPHIIEAVLNHVSGHKGGVAGIYNRATYDREKRDALNLWAEHLLAVIEGRAALVVPLKRA